MRLFLPRGQIKEKPGENPLGVRALDIKNREERGLSEYDQEHPILCGSAHPLTKAKNLLTSPNLIKCQHIDHILAEHTRQHPFLFAVKAACKHSLAFEMGPDDVWLILQRVDSQKY